MSLFGGGGRERRDFMGIHNPFENPSVPLSSIGLDSVFGEAANNDSGQSITVETAVAIPTVIRCVALLSTVIAGCPIRTFKNPGKKEIFPDILQSDTQAMLYTQYELWELIVAHICLYGNAFVLKVRRGTAMAMTTGKRVPAGHPAEAEIVDLRPINPERVKVKLHNGNKIFEVDPVDKNGVVITAAKPTIYTEYELMHIPGLGYNGVEGLSPIMMAKRTLGTSIAADKLAARFYNKGTLLSGVINVRAPLANQEQADEIRRRWISKNGGLNPAHEVAVLDAETSFQPLTIPPEALQFLESRRWQTNEIARIYGIPPHLVGDVEKSTSWGSGIEQQNVGFIAYTVSAYTNRIEQRVTREVIHTNKQYCEFDMSRLLRGDMQERYAAYATAIQWGYMTRNEARTAENWEPIDGLDEPLTPLNMQTGNPNDELAPKGATGPTQGKAPKPSNDQGSDPS